MRKKGLLLKKKAAKKGMSTRRLLLETKLNQAKAAHEETLKAMLHTDHKKRPSNEDFHLSRNALQAAQSARDAYLENKRK